MATSLGSRSILALAMAGAMSGGACAAIFGEGASNAVAAAACPAWGGNAIGANFGMAAEVNAQLGVFVQSAYEIATITSQIQGEVVTACKNMGRDLGLSDDQMKPIDGAGGNVKGPCNAVSARIGEILKAGVKVDVAFTPPSCKVDASFEARCYGECKVEIEPAKIIAECEPGHLSGYCEGTCQGSCEGTCNGTCNGECSVKDAQGNCAGYCSGTCEGSCDATCHAKCEGSWKAPHCDVQVTPGKAEAECQAACQARADINASCTKPTVQIDTQGTDDVAKLIATLRVNLPALLNAQIRLGKQIRGDVKAMVDAGASLRGRLKGAGGNAIACLSAATNALAEASIRVSVSVEVSASISGKVGANAG